MYYRPTPAQIAEVEANRIRGFIAARAGDAAAPARAPAAPAAAPSPVDPIDQARAAGVAEVRGVTAEVAALCTAAGREDMFTSLIGATVAETKAALNAALWADAFAAIDASPAMKPASNSENAQLWDAAFRKADEARVAAGTKAPAPGSADDPGV